MSIREEITEYTTEACVLTEEYYDDAIVGISADDRVVYAFTKMVEALSKAENMTTEQAQEYIEHNILRAIPYLGQKAPIIIYSLEGIEE